ncbi:hypothetical protein BW730_04840 [Tessaracoccus aquimaris]|uniref:Uncharacterized protein n=1 Tax=Tessaracoccus aquimaris TaxID=1332264 RepID=A0A1Q2CLE9_9ACTN|nr:hypothetical protein [Tessaracoccus aquimaris]AQP46948.1 hypothetical protein BW730_04840 [Tessaracoccus aquimaris]
MSTSQTITAGVVLLTVIGIAYGGSFLLRVLSRTVPANDLQRSYFRAGHAHAGVLVILGLVVMLLMAVAGVTGLFATLSMGVLWAAILMPAGFFLSVVGRDPEKPNGLRYLIYAGGLVLVVGVGSAGIGLIAAGIA